MQKATFYLIMSRQELTITDALDTLQAMFTNVRRNSIRTVLIDQCLGNMEHTVEILLMQYSVPQPPNLTPHFLQPPSYYYSQQNEGEIPTYPDETYSDQLFVCKHLLTTKSMNLVCCNWYRRHNQGFITNDIIDLIWQFAKCSSQRIQIMTLTQKLITMTICLDGFILDIMRKFQELEGIPINLHQLIYNETKISDHPYQPFEEFYNPLNLKLFFVLK